MQKGGLNVHEIGEFMDTVQVGQYLGRSPAAVRNLVLRRQIPFRKPAGRLVFLKDEIQRWVRTAPGLTFEELQGDVKCLKSA